MKPFFLLFQSLPSLCLPVSPSISSYSFPAYSPSFHSFLLSSLPHFLVLFHIVSLPLPLFLTIPLIPFSFWLRLSTLSVCLSVSLSISLALLLSFSLPHFILFNFFLPLPSVSPSRYLLFSFTLPPSSLFPILPLTSLLVPFSFHISCHLFSPSVFFASVSLLPLCRAYFRSSCDGKSHHIT